MRTADRRTRTISLLFVLPLLFSAGALHADLLEDLRYETPREKTAAPLTSGILKMQIPCVSTAPQLDGELTEACWQDKQADLGHFRIGLSPTPARHSRQAWACYDANNLYLAIKQQREPGKPLRVNTKRNDDGMIWEDDEIEMFFDPFGTGTTYYQLIINSAGYLFDSANHYEIVLNPAGASPTDMMSVLKQDLSWSSGLQRKTAVQDDFWTAEVALPLASLGLTSAPVGHNLRCNITSADWDTNEYTCLSPTSDWQDPAQFGTLVLGAPQVAVDTVELGQVGLGNNVLRANVRDLTGKPAALSVQLTLKTDAGVRQYLEPFELPANATERTSLDFSTTADKGPWIADIRILNTTGQPLYATRRVGVIPAPLMVRLGSQAAFNDGGPLKMAAKLGMGSRTARQVTLRAELLDASGRLIREQNLGKAKGTDLSARMPLDGLREGNYTLRLQATWGAGQSACAETPLRIVTSPFSGQ